MTENYLVFISVGERHWTKLTVLSFLSMQCRLAVDIPKYKTLIITDKARAFKGFFGEWVDVISLDSKMVLEKYKDLKKMKFQVLYDLASEKPKANFLYSDSDVYYNQSGLSAFNKLGEGKLVLGENKGIPNTSLIGIPAEKASSLKQIRNGDFTGLDFETFEDSYHYAEEMPVKLAQIQSFFDRHYYREMGELFSAAKLWTPDKWHLSADELPEEII